jgi:hypothetical protein
MESSSAVERKTFCTLSVALQWRCRSGRICARTIVLAWRFGHTSSPHDLNIRLAHFCWASSANELCHSAMKLRFLLSDACALAFILPLQRHAFARWSG